MSEPKTVRVRIAVAVDGECGWVASGSDIHTEERRLSSVVEDLATGGLPWEAHWIEANVPLPLAP